MEIEIRTSTWNNVNINTLTKKTLLNIKRFCVLNFVLCCLVFCLGCIWLSIALYGAIKYKDSNNDVNKIKHLTNWFLLTTFLINTIPTGISIKIFLDIKNLTNWNIKNLLFDLSVCNFILQFFSLFGGLVCCYLIFKKIRQILNYPIIIENKHLYVNNFNNLKNKVITNFKYTFISEPNLSCNIKAIKLNHENKTLEFHIFTSHNFFKINVLIPELYIIWPIKNKTNLIPIVQHLYLDPEQKIIKIHYLARPKTCFNNNASFYESIVILHL